MPLEKIFANLFPIFVSASHQTGLTQDQWPEGRLEWGFRGEEGRSRAEAESSTQHNVGLMTQIWVQARMPDYSLNWTAKSQGWQRYQWYSSPSQRWPSRSLSVSSLLWNIDRPARMSNCPLNSQRKFSQFVPPSMGK